MSCDGFHDKHAYLPNAAGGSWAAGMLGSAGLGFGAPPLLGPSMMFPVSGATAAGVYGMRHQLKPYHKGPGRAPKSAVSSALQQQSTAGCYKMLVARVALGKQATGQSGMRKPPEVRICYQLAMSLPLAR